MKPNYKKIYYDLLASEFPDKLKDNKVRENLEKLNTSEEVIKFNDYIFQKSKESNKDNQKLKTYDKDTMLKILNYQKKHSFSNSYISRTYKMSRTTIAKWKKLCEGELLAEELS